jgi:hypothetical protein
VFYTEASDFGRGSEAAIKVSGVEVVHTFVGFEFCASVAVARGEDCSEHHSALQMVQAVTMRSFMIMSLASYSAAVMVL